MITRYETLSQQLWYVSLTKFKGADLAGALVRLTRHPRYSTARPTPDHYYPLLVVAGSMADLSEDAPYGVKKAQTNELQHMINNQYIWGEFGKGREEVVA